MDHPHTSTALLPAARPANTWLAATLRGQNDGVKPDPGDAAGGIVHRAQRGHGSPYKRHRFASHFTRGDIELRAKVDEAHQTLCGPATKRILEREFERYEDATYERLSSISIAHIYNLRQRRHYRECCMSYTATRPVQVAIGERRRPQPLGRSGYLRVDTVDQGDLEPVLRAILEPFPFSLRGFHSGNGSEFINDMVSGLLKDC